MKTRFMALLLSAVMLLGLSACGNTQSSVQKESESPAAAGAESSDPTGEAVTAGEPVVIENMGLTTTYEAAPETAVALSYSIAEIMVALGLEEKIVAVAPSMYLLEHVSEEYRDVVGALPVLEGNYGVPSLETVLDTNAEFVFGDFYSFYATSVGTAEDFQKAGVNIYATEGTYVSDPTFENTYHDILNIGRIFRVEDRAEDLVAELREREAAVTEKVDGLAPVDVFYYDSNASESMFTIGDTGLQLYMLELAGCRNIFDDIEGDFVSVSLEDVIDRDPEYIIICDYYGSGYAEEKIAEMKENPETAGMDAVANGNFIIVSGLSMFPSLENLDTVEQIAEVVHS